MDDFGLQQASKLAMYHSKLMLPDWQKTESLSINLNGLNLNAIWKNIIIQIGQIHLTDGNTLDE